MELESKLNKYIDDIGFEEKLLKYPIDMFLGFNEKNVKDKIRENISLLYKYNILLLRAQAKYEFLENVLNEIIGEQYDWYKFEYDKSLSKDEIMEIYLDKDPKVRQSKRELMKQKTHLDFFKMCKNCIIQQGERMHDFIQK